MKSHQKILRASSCSSWTILFLLCASSAVAQATQEYRDAGVKVLAQIDRRFAVPEPELLAGQIDLNHPEKRNPANMWAEGVELTALTAAAKLDPNYEPRLKTFTAGLNRYWIVKDNLGAYNGNLHGKTERYYDDNEWIVLGLLEAYEVLHDDALLKRAQETFRFVMSGEDQKLGGGIYWRESDRATKNTCSNAPAIVCALRLEQLAHDSANEKIALDLYKWTNSTLQDKDGLYFDHIDLAGHVNRAKFSYNSALMIRANVLLFDQTHEQKYLSEAQRIAHAAIKQWIASDGAIRDDGCFAHLLTESLLELGARDHDPAWREAVNRSLQFLLTQNADPAGFHPKHWNETPRQPLEHVTLLTEASAARALLRAAWRNP
jgi:hypothetical protein